MAVPGLTTRRSLFGALALPIAMGAPALAVARPSREEEIQRHTKALVALLKPGAPEGTTHITVTIRGELGIEVPTYLHVVAVRTGIEFPCPNSKGLPVDRHLAVWTSRRKAGDYEVYN